MGKYILKQWVEIPRVMGVINRSPNSFYQPTQDDEAGLKLAGEMVAAGVDIIDVGGEATNPFVDIKRESPEAQAEAQRVVPLVRMIKQYYPQVLVSIDTSSPYVMEKALDAGADMINDQRALARPGALEVVAAYQPMVCLMHFFQPMRQAQSSSKRALLQRICDELTLALVAAREAGLPAEQLCLDPGFGGGNFGKSTSENFYLLHQLPQFLSLGQPLLVGWSRKSMLGDVLGGVGPEGRLFGGIAAATLALQRGASIIRTHDVKPTVDAVKVYQAMLAQQEIQEEQGVC